jgi:hypothetical protein
VVLCENARSFAMRRYFWIKVVSRESHIYGDIVENFFLDIFNPISKCSYWRCRACTVHQKRF